MRPWMPIGVYRTTPLPILPIPKPVKYKTPKFLSLAPRDRPPHNSVTKSKDQVQDTETPAQ